MKNLAVMIKDTDGLIREFTCPCGIALDITGDAFCEVEIDGKKTGMFLVHRLEIWANASGGISAALSGKPSILDSIKAVLFGKRQAITREWKAVKVGLKSKEVFYIVAEGGKMPVKQAFFSVSPAELVVAA
jgi:hypothetical protein